MAMNADVLAHELQNLAPVATEAQAVVNFANAYETFAKDASAGATTISSAAVDAGKAAMQVALVGMSTPGNGAAKLFAGVTAFWGAVAPMLSTAFSGCIAITPPPHSGLVAGLLSVFASNTSGALSKNAATQNVAVVFYNQVIIAGSVTFPPSVISPII